MSWTPACSTTRPLGTGTTTTRPSSVSTPPPIYTTTLTSSDFGGLPLDLTEGDVLTVFSQYGNPVYVKLIRDRDTGKSKGYGFLKYADQRSTVLAVDNLNGVELLGRRIRVDHTEFELKHEDEADFEEVGRQVLAATNSYAGETGGDTVPPRKQKEKREPKASREKQQDELEKEEMDPMAEYIKKSQAKSRRR